ncbi:MAG: deoxyribose-phosphate aldolase [Bacteroidia bacterium]|nr:MAG: deoxyribose-phosphate aldolase [Bacteroidia bacterium]
MMNPFHKTALPEIRKVTGKLELPDNEYTYRRILSFLDLTSLNVTDNEISVSVLCERVNNFRYLFPDLHNVAAICVYPRFIPLVKKLLSAEGVKIASVGACFPSSQSFTSVKTEECRLAAEAGSDEIDMVMSVGDLIAGNTEYVSGEIKAVKEVIGNVHLKVILETGVIDDASTIYRASVIAMEAGADFIKTSTGKSPVSATPEAAWIMCTAIRDYFAETGRKVGFKPAGGISSSSDAALYYAIVNHLLGKEWLVPELFRIGASRLANSILTSVEGRSVDYF